MTTSKKNPTTADSGSGEDPIIVKDSGSGEDPIIVKDSGSGEDPIIVKNGGPGEETSLAILLDTAEMMGWTITTTKGITTIIIPDKANWRIETDRVSKKVYLERPGRIITKILVDDMVDQANPSLDVPPSQIPKSGNDPEIEIYFAPI